MANQPFKRFGVMLDMSRNSVMTIPALKEFSTELAKMGYNMLMLYTEDTYEIPEEPYFGHFRGRYTQAEIREVVAHCKTLGMEVIPCIQTLAHVEALFKWKRFQPLCDSEDILLVDNEETYELIRKMFKSVKACYETRQVHIGMDEAITLGLGKYLQEHGFQNRFEILSRHLHRVCDIAREEGLIPNIWSDMFFRLANNNVYAQTKPRVDLEQIGHIPEELNLTYWDYYSTLKRRYRAMIRAHRKMGKNPWFACGIWTWKGWAPDNHHSISTSLAGLQVAAEEGVENVMVTLWGDFGGECSRWAALPGLYTAAKFVHGEKSRKKIAEDFEKEYGISMRRFMEIDMKTKTKKPNNPERYLLFQDPFLGMMDSALFGDENEFYRKSAAKLSRNAKHERFGLLFGTQTSLARTLSYKAQLGAKTRELYQKGDKEAMRRLLKDYTLTIRNLRIFMDKANELWLSENKPQGLELVQLRLGGLLQRIIFCKQRLEDWVEKDARIPELEEEALDYGGGGTEFKPAHLETYHIDGYKTPAV